MTTSRRSRFLGRWATCALGLSVAGPACLPGSLGAQQPFAVASNDLPALPPANETPAASAGRSAATLTRAELPEAPSELLRRAAARLAAADAETAPASQLPGFRFHRPLPQQPAVDPPVAGREQPGVRDLGLDAAVATAVKNNYTVRLSTRQEKVVHGTIFVVGNALVPNLRVKAYSEAEQIDLAALGFKPQTLSSINLPGLSASSIQPIVKVNVTAAQLSLSQALFNVPAFFLFRAAQRAQDASHWTTLDARGGVVQGVGAVYLQAIADASQARDARALLGQDQVVFDHAREARDAGTGINLDVLRAQTDLQNEQQRVLQAENALAKDKIMLNRLMGAPAGQALNLTDTIPFAELPEQPLDYQLATAYRERQDLLSLESQLSVAEQTERAVKYERLPSLGINGFYGVIGETTGSYHGNFVAQFTASIPIFLEGELRGQREIAVAQSRALRSQISARRAQIEGEIRSSRLDIASSRRLVTVARSNVMLAQQALDDAALRFTAGVDDNLPVAQAQAALVTAQTRVVQAEFQYNYSKLTLARRMGLAETDYDRFLGR